MAETYDVIIIGAGPAGSTCAYDCADLGLSTLLLEAERFPRDKPCGGMIDATALEHYPEIEPVVERRTERAKTFYNGEFIEEHHNVNLMITRTRFDEFLARRAEKRGARLLDGHKVTDATVEDGGVRVACGGSEGFRGRLLVDASGPKSGFFRDHKRRVERMIKYRIVSMVLEAPCPNDVMEERLGFDAERGRTYFQSHLWTGFIGYGWYFPKDGVMNAGLGTITTHSGGLKERFRDFLETTGFGDLDFSRTAAGVIPVKVLPQLWLPRVLFVGDAGGFVDPLTGGGILLGMSSGEKAAMTAKMAVDAGDFTGRILRHYQRQCAQMSKELWFKTKVLKWAAAGVEMGFDREVLVKWVLRKLQRKFDSSEFKNL